MRAPLHLIESTPTLPAHADAVVIGGGIVGVFSAYYLARRGHKVALLEKGAIGAEQSCRNWGWCRQQNRDARELPLSTKSLDLWEAFARDSGEDTGFSRTGLLYLSNDEAELAGWAKWRDFAKTVGVTTHMLDARQAGERGAATGKDWKGGVFSPTDGIADPSRAAPAVAKAIMALGSTVHQTCAARGLETEGGRLSAVVTEAGSIKTKVVVMAGGAWSSSFCRQFGYSFPQASIRSSIVALGPGQGEIPAALHTKAISITRRGDGGHTLAISGMGRLDPTFQHLLYSRHFLPMFARRWRSLAPGGFEGLRSGHETLKRWTLDAPTPMERIRILDPRPDPRAVRIMLQRARDLLPGLKTAPVTANWAGYIDSTPDGVPAIGPVASLPGLIMATGFSGHGFGIGPGAGHLVADIVEGTPPIVEATAYSPDRFRRPGDTKVAEF
ncbi:NAD(P)/FAD-dependent oxidoreductase [Rhodospirillum sp. A1_3_36]|uniref:NAD(P)/FAD-dependent oxidoreductase n=1 Tax=Rhodospirillum sp. A1_3_36 TaxID=3391666 RepID=UPI0039A52A7D